MDGRKKVDVRLCFFVGTPEETSLKKNNLTIPSPKQILFYC